MVYCFKCKDCGARGESTRALTWCLECGGDNVVRDWKAEGVGIGTGVRVSRTGTDRDQRDLFLPSAKDYAGPGDPDGSKGIRNWNAEHEHMGGGKPLRPDAPKESF